MKLAFAVLCIATLGCGGNSSLSDTLQGTWIDTSDPAAICANGLEFSGAVMKFISLCATGNSSGNAQESDGDFTADGSHLSVHFVRSSCALSATDRQWDVEYSFVSGKLRLMDTSAVVLLERDNAEPLAGAFTFGCFDSTGTFSPRPVTPL